MANLRLESPKTIKKIYNKELSDSDEIVSIEEQVFIEKHIHKKSSSAPDPHHKFEIQLAPEKEQQTKSCFTCLRPFKGYAYGLLYVMAICITNILLKMCTSMNVFNHTLIRYGIQLFVMLFFVKTSHSDLRGHSNETTGLLTLRGLTGFSALCFSYLSLGYLDVSDVESVQNSGVLITAFLSRIFLKEKLSTCHLVSLVFTIVGVVLILRPTILFGIETDLEKLLNYNLTTGLNHTAGVESRYSKKALIASSIGVSAVVASALFSSISHITIKKLCIYNIHFSVISMYPVIFGLPISALMSVWLFILQSKCVFEILPMHLVLSSCGGLVSIFGLISLNKALEIEDTTRIAMLRTTSVLFSFILQYVVLGVETDLLGILGAVFIIVGTLTVVFIKLYDYKLENNKCCDVLVTRF